MQSYKEVNILLVEDDDIDAMAIERAFKKSKIANPLLRVRDGIEALELLNAKDPEISRPYIILLDINMPRMNGIEFLKEIRSNYELRDSAVFILTTSNADEDKVAAHKLNVTGYIVKSQVSEGFYDVVNLLDSYWKIVELPV